MNNPQNKQIAKGSPLDVLAQFCQRQATGRLQFLTDSVIWTIRLEGGKITYVRNTVEPFDRLICHLRYMSYQVPSLTKEFRSQVCMMFEDATDPAEAEHTGFAAEDPSLSSNDYTALCWLAREQHLTQAQVAKIVEGMTREAIEPLFWLEEATYRYTQHIGNPVTFCQIDLPALVACCQQRLQVWQLFPPFVKSPYQRPYFFGHTESQKKLLPELQLQQKFSTILKGLSFRHLGVLMNKDELKVAGALIPYIVEEIVVLRDPQPPFDLLPNIPSAIPEAFKKYAKQATVSPPNIISKSEDTLFEVPSEQSTYTIACIDDSPTVLSDWTVRSSMFI